MGQKVCGLQGIWKLTACSQVLPVRRPGLIKDESSGKQEPTRPRKDRSVVRKAGVAEPNYRGDLGLAKIWLFLGVVSGSGRSRGV